MLQLDFGFTFPLRGATSGPCDLFDERTVYISGTNVTCALSERLQAETLGPSRAKIRRLVVILEQINLKFLRPQSVELILKILLIAFIFLMLFMNQTREARAADTANIAALESLSQATVYLFELEENPNNRHPIDVQEFINEVYTRLETYDKSFAEVLKRSLDFPNAVKHELKREIDKRLWQEIMSIMLLVAEDTESIADSGNTIVDAAVRLNRLQETSRKLMQHEEDLNLPYIVSAMKVEAAFIGSLNVSEITVESDWEVRRKSYQDRIAKTSDLGRVDSLISRREILKAKIEEEMNSYRKKLKNRERYINRELIRRLNVCEERVRLRFNKQPLERVLLLGKKSVKPQEVFLKIYDFMVGSANYILASESGGVTTKPTLSLDEMSYMDRLQELEEEFEEFASQFPRETIHAHDPPPGHTCP